MQTNIQSCKTNPSPSIRINYYWEAQYWASKWNVSIAEIENAIGKVGPAADDIAQELGKRAA